MSEEINGINEQKKAIIIGCGIAGPSLAIALGRARIKSTIYELHEGNLGLIPSEDNLLT